VNSQETVTLKEGDWVSLILGTANRDPENFENAQQLNINRDTKRHLAFGRGQHVCLGRNLARLEVETLLTKILTNEKFDNMSIDTTQKLLWEPNLDFKRLMRLHLKLQ